MNLIITLQIKQFVKTILRGTCDMFCFSAKRCEPICSFGDNRLHSIYLNTECSVLFLTATAFTLIAWRYKKRARKNS